MNLDLSEGYRVLSPGMGIRPHETFLRRRSNGEVDVIRGPYAITLGGNYMLTLTLTQADTLRIFVEAFRGAELLAAVAQLAKAASGDDAA